MTRLEPREAVEIAISNAASLGLQVDGAVVLQASNRFAIRLLPCDLLVRVAPESLRTGAEFELNVAMALTGTRSPIAGFDSRVEPLVYAESGWILTYWAYHEPVVSAATPAAYARALQDLHAGMREVELTAPHFTSRVGEALDIVDDPGRSPALAAPDRAFLSDTLRTSTAEVAARGAREQLLHGEPHAGNLLNTRRGPLFIDLETCCRGPVEFDVAGAPEEVAEHYRGLDERLLEACRTLSLALVAAWRWDREDQLPGGRQMGHDLLAQLRNRSRR